MARPGGPPFASSLPAGSEIDRLRAAVAQFFPVYETRVTPNSLVLLVHVDPATLEDRFDRLRRQLWEQFYVPQVRYERGEYYIEVVRRPTRTGWGSVTNLVLLGLTILTTVTAGAFLWLSYVGGSQLTVTDFLYGGASFGLPLLAVLGLHELAHFVTARHHHVDASLPYFIPVPPPFILFGTFGAFISLREPIPSRKALLDIGASGPLAGFAVAIPVTVFGMFLSAHAPVLSTANCGPSFFGVSYGNFVIGTSLFWFLLGQLVPVSFVSLHPVALAGWVGLLVTSINLLPAGQLDGGHVFRALLGERARYVSYAAVALLFGAGLVYQGWIIFGVLILVLGVRHPPPLNDLTPLDVRRRALGAAAALILVTGFVLVPISAPSNAFSVSSSSLSLAPLPPGAAISDNLSVTVSNDDVIAHGFLLEGSIVSVRLNNSTVLTTPGELAPYSHNATWTVYLPNGNVSTYSATGLFFTPGGQYFTIDSGNQSKVTVTYSNTQAGTVILELTVTEICNSGGPGPVSTKFTAS